MSVIKKNFSKTSAKSNSKAVSTAKSEKLDSKAIKKQAQNGKGKLDSKAIEKKLQARHEQLLAQGYVTTYGGKALPQTEKWSDRLIASPNGEVMRELDVMFSVDLANAERVRLAQAREKREAKRAEKRANSEAARQARLDAEREEYARSSKEERLAKQAEHEKMLRECRTKYGITEQAEKAIADKLTYDYVISEKTIMPLSIAAALKSLRFFVNRSGQPRMFELYFNLLTDVNRHMHDVGSVLTDAMDLVQTAAMTFCKYKKSADERHETADSRSESDGTYTNSRTGLPVTVFGEAVHEVNKLIAQDRRKSTKLTYLEDLDENGHPIYLSVDSNLQISTVDELEYFDEAIDELCSSNNKQEHDTLEKTLVARLGGYSIHQIAKKRHTAPSQVRKTMRKLQKRAYELGYSVPAGYTPEGGMAGDKPE